MMKKLLFLFLLLSAPFLSAQKVQTWSSENGHRFEGTFVSMDGQSVTLLGKDGKEVIVPLSALDDASVLQARKADGQNVPGTPPVFSHQNRHLRFSLYPGGQWITFEFLQANQVIDQKLHSMNFSLSEVKDRKWKRIRFKELVGEVEETRSDVSYRMRMENGVVVRFTVKVNDTDELEFKFETTEVPDDLPPVHLRVGMGFPGFLKYDVPSKKYFGPPAPEGALFAELPEALEGYEIQLSGHSGGSRKIPMHEKMSGTFAGREVAVFNPGITPIVLTAPKKSGEGVLSSYFYGGKMPSQGFGIRFSPGNNNQSGYFSIRLKK